MKLYATVAADKLINGVTKQVSKGQGGNEYLDIRVLNEKQVEILGIFINAKSGKVHIVKPSHKLDHVRYEYLLNEVRLPFVGEDTCNACGAPMHGLVKVHHHTENGIDVTKGEKQKGELCNCEMSNQYAHVYDKTHK